MDCADAVQQAVFQGWINRRKLRDAEKFRSWLTAILVNECRNLQRRAMKQKWAVEASIEEMRRPPNEGTNIDLQAALSQLPDKYRLPIVLHYIEDYPTKIIAGIMEIPEGRLRERMRTARKLLGRMLKHESDG
jgi:RNA polymerase sigma-70 factor (ECF subfamily)